MVSKTLDRSRLDRKLSQRVPEILRSETSAADCGLIEEESNSNGGIMYASARRNVKTTMVSASNGLLHNAVDAAQQTNIRRGIDVDGAKLH
ncbi:hypothetical protein V7S43_005594 [Phytophthora oleae]|uniref:Uncharacterized protein n=1 Tax=Phytophthora oleae TaxID=2107226 RepID=A0ABD3FSD4_9STRA